MPALRLVGLSALLQLLRGVLADGLEQPVAHRPSSPLRPPPATCPPAPEKVQDLFLLESATRTHRLRRLQGPAPREDREPSEAALSPARTAARSSSLASPSSVRCLGRASGSAGRRLQSGLRASRRSAPRPALPPSPPQALWPAASLQPPADLRHGLRVLGVSAKAGDGSGPAPRRAGPTRSLRAPPPSSSRIRSGTERGGTGQMTSPATPRASRLVARNSQVRARAEENIHQARHGLHEVLAVVQDQEQLLAARRRPACRWSGSPGCSCTPRPRPPPGPPVRLRERRELDQPHPVRVGTDQVRCATSRASRVLPDPPAPVSVSSRVMASSRLTSTISRSRPTKLVLGAGRLCFLRRPNPPAYGTTGGTWGNLPPLSPRVERPVAASGSASSLWRGPPGAARTASGPLPAGREGVQAHQAACASSRPDLRPRAPSVLRRQPSHSPCSS